MRIWLVEERRPESAPGLEALVRALEADTGSVLLVRAGPLTADAVAALRAVQPDLLLIDGPTWPVASWAEEILGLGVGIVVVANRAATERFQTVAESQPVVFLAPTPTPEALWLGLLSADSARRRQAALRQQIERLQQRLSDRIIVERAKGILVQRLHITEAEAYNRLRVLSRRQRRQLRDIAQSLLDTQSLLLPETNGQASGPLLEAGEDVTAPED